MTRIKEMHDDLGNIEFLLVAVSNCMVAALDRRMLPDGTHWDSTYIDTYESVKNLLPRLDMINGHCDGIRHMTGLIAKDIGKWLETYKPEGETR